MLIRNTFNKNISIEEICIEYKYFEDVRIEKEEIGLNKNHGYVGMSDDNEMIWYSLSRICYYILIESYKSWEYKDMQEPIFLPAYRNEKISSDKSENVVIQKDVSIRKLMKQWEKQQVKFDFINSSAYYGRIELDDLGEGRIRI